MDTPRLRLGGLNPASPADPTAPASSSPPISDFGMDLGHSSVSAIQMASNAAPPLGRGSRSGSFCAGGGGGGASLGFGEHGGGDGIVPGQPGLGVRGHPSGSGDYVSPERCGTSIRTAERVARLVSSSVVVGGGVVGYNRLGDAQSNHSPKWFDEGVCLPGFRDVEDAACSMFPLPSCSPTRIPGKNIISYYYNINSTVLCLLRPNFHTDMYCTARTHWQL